MLTYDQFTARIAVRGGSVASTSGASTSGKTFEQPAELDPWLVKAPDLADWDPDQPLLLANRDPCNGRSRANLVPWSPWSLSRSFGEEHGELASFGKGLHCFSSVCLV